MQQSPLTFCVHGVGVLHCFKTPFFVFECKAYFFRIYRALAEINTVRGNNTEKSGKNRCRINGVQAKVLTLLSNMNDFCSCL